MRGDDMKKSLPRKRGRAFYVMETSQTPEAKSEESSSAPEAGDNTSIVSGANQQPPASGNGKTQNLPKTDLKPYTIDLPMFDLEEMLAFVSEIQSKGLEKAKMPDVAKAFNYESASSTSFYRKLVAARHFGLIVANGAELTERARDYIAPTADDSKAKALLEAVQGISYFAEVLSQHTGKRVNIELVGNEIARKFSVNSTCGKRCAKVFEISARFAGLLSTENFVSVGAAAKASPAKDERSHGEIEATEDTQKHTLYLDKLKRRNFQMVAPLTITPAELERIKNWLSFTIIVDEAEI